MVPTASGSGSNGSVSKVEASYSTPNLCNHGNLCCINGERNPRAFHSRKYFWIRIALAANSLFEAYSFPSCSRPCTPTSNPCWFSLAGKSGGTEYSPSGTKLKDERKPWRASSSINRLTRLRPLEPSTSWVRTTANCFSSGQPGHPGGVAPAFGSIGHTGL